MKNISKIFLVAALMLVTSTAFAESPYPQTLENGSFICVDGGMGVGRYADKNSVSVDKYAPPFYELSIDIYSISFSDAYWREHGTYVGGPYTVGSSYRLNFKYNWDTKTVFHLESLGFKPQLQPRGGQSPNSERRRSCILFRVQNEIFWR